MDSSTLQCSSSTVNQYLSTDGPWRFVFDPAGSDKTQKRAVNESKDGNKRAKYTASSIAAEVIIAIFIYTIETRANANITPSEHGWLYLISDGSSTKYFCSQDCKRRKVKCSGEDVCRHCSARKVTCVYESTASGQVVESSAPSEIQDKGSAEDGTRFDSERIDEMRSTEHKRVVPNQGILQTNSRSSTSALDGGPKDPELYDRIAALERMVNHLVEWSKSSPRYNEHMIESQQTTFQTPLRPPSAHGDEEENNMFAARHLPDDLSLSSQVTAMGALLSKPPSPKPNGQKQSSKSPVLVELPDPPSLQHLFDVYFCDFDSYFPFLHREETESRIYALIRRLGYSSYNRMLLVTSEDLSEVALTCLMLAMAECLDSEEGAVDADSRTGWTMYIQGARAVQRFFYSKDADLDLVRAQCLIAAYLMHSGALIAASNAISVVFQMSTAIKLNDQKQWSTEAPNEILSKKYLWWTIYFLDRRIAQKSGAAYHIRDTEFFVEEFRNPNSMQSDQSSSQQVSTKPTPENYFQALIDIARLWGQIWDTLFAIGASKKGDWLEVEIMDTKIINIGRHLPEELCWNAENVTHCRMNGEPETRLNRRLHIYTRLNLLRMLIRQNPLSQTAFNPETAHMCARLSREIIHAHDIFMRNNSGVRAVGYFATASMVECVYHLAPVLHYSKISEEHNACLVALKQAHKIILQLSPKLNVAKRALKALKGVIERWTSETVDYSSWSNDTGGGLREPGNISNPLVATHPYEGGSNTLHPGTDILDAEEWINMPMGAMFGEEFEFNCNF